jgi:hypothetical protein
MMIDQYVIVTVQRDRFYRVSRELDEERQLDIVYGLLRKAIKDRARVPKQIPGGRRSPRRKNQANLVTARIFWTSAMK